MYSDWIWLPYLAVFITSVAVIWLASLSFLVFRQESFLKKLFPKLGERDIRKKFEEVLQIVSRSKLDIAKLEDKLEELEKQGFLHIQRSALLRYNPYQDTGGDQSFSLALLDKVGDGLVITSLHSRDTTRIFAKPVVRGKAGKYKFSKEEEEVIKKAIMKV